MDLKPHPSTSNLPAEPRLCHTTAPLSLSTIPASILDKILSYLSHTDLISLSSTCASLHACLVNHVYSTLTITSPSPFISLVSHLDSHIWPGQSTSIHSFTLRWSHEVPTTLETPSSRRAHAQSIILSLCILLESYTFAVHTLILDFPGAGICFQSAVLHQQVLPHTHLKHLTITNGLCPSYQPAPFLLCAVSTLCARSLEELVLVGGFAEGVGAKMHVPGWNMFCNYEILVRLQYLEVRGISGFVDRCLEWVVVGGGVLKVVVDGGTGVTMDAINRILNPNAGWGLTPEKPDIIHTPDPTKPITRKHSSPGKFTYDTGSIHKQSPVGTTNPTPSKDATIPRHTTHPHELHLCDINPTMCQHPRHLDIPPAHLPHSNSIRPLTPPPDTDVGYISSNVSFVANMPPTPPASLKHRTSSLCHDNLEGVKLRGGDVKKVDLLMRYLRKVL